MTRERPAQAIGALRFAPSCKDTVARNQDGSVNLDENKNPRIMTDGSGLMSLDLAKRLPMVKSGMLVHGELVAHDGTAMADRDAPFGAQVRI
eukprot:6200609-Pleurochrysis_carterae.AAC.1